MRSTRALALVFLLSSTAVLASHSSSDPSHLLARDQHHKLNRRLVFSVDPDDSSDSGASASASLSSASASAAASSSATASSASASRAAASSTSAAAAASSSSAVEGASSRSAASASSASATSASRASASSAAAAATSISTTAQPSTFYLTSTVDAPTTTTTPTASSTADAQTAEDDSNGVSKGLIIGVSVAGGVLILAGFVFLYMKFGGKRFDGLEDNDADIKWPELKIDPDSAAMQPLPARRTGGAGFDMGDESDNGHDGGYGQSVKGRDSFTGSTTALASTAPGYPMSDPHYGSGMDTGGYMPHQPNMEPGQYYDMYSQNHSVPQGYHAGDVGAYLDPSRGYADQGYGDTPNPYSSDPYGNPHAHAGLQSGGYPQHRI